MTTSHPALARRLLPLLAASCALSLALPQVAAAQSAQYVGPETCKACHPAAYERWQSSAHARSSRSLTEKQLGQPSCAACHAPQMTQGQKKAAVSCESWQNISSAQHNQ